MLNVENLKKDFGSFHAVKGVSFTVGKGEVLGFLGPNGAGKSTTMRMITGFIPPTSGTATICGHDILQDLLQREGLSPGLCYLDCGVLIYDLKTQDVHAGGSGCGCSAAVLCAHILPAMTRGIWKRVLFAGTGALMSPLTCQQGCSIPGICHAVALEWEGD